MKITGEELPCTDYLFELLTLLLVVKMSGDIERYIRNLMQEMEESRSYTQSLEQKVRNLHVQLTASQRQISDLREQLDQTLNTYSEYVDQFPYLLKQIRDYRMRYGFLPDIDPVTARNVEEVTYPHIYRGRLEDTIPDNVRRTHTPQKVFKTLW